MKIHTRSSSIRRLTGFEPNHATKLWHFQLARRPVLNAKFMLRRCFPPRRHDVNSSTAAKKITKTTARNTWVSSARRLAELFSVLDLKRRWMVERWTIRGTESRRRHRARLHSHQSRQREKKLKSTSHLATHYYSSRQRFSNYVMRVAETIDHSVWQSTTTSRVCGLNTVLISLEWSIKRFGVCHRRCLQGCLWWST